MNSEKLNLQVKFWALIGPQISLLTLLVFLIKGSATPFLFPLILTLGVPICWHWKLKGFGGLVAVLLASMAYYYTEIPLEERFWHLGMGFSILISLLITALSFEEVEALVEGMKLESRSRLENLWNVDEKLQQTALELKKKKEKIREMNVKARSYQKVLDKSTEDLIEARSQWQQAKDELYQTSHELDGIRRKVEEFQKAVGPEAVQKEFLLQLEEKQKDLDRVRKELFEANEKLFSFEKEREELSVYEMSEVEEALQRHLLKMEKEREDESLEHQLELDAMQEILSRLLKP